MLFPDLAARLNEGRVLVASIGGVRNLIEDDNSLVAAVIFRENEKRSVPLENGIIRDVNGDYVAELGYGLNRGYGIPIQLLTMFGPTNSAFEKVMEDDRKYLFSLEGRSTLKDVLMYHLIYRQINFENLDCNKEYTMANYEVTTTRCKSNGFKYQVGEGNMRDPEIVIGDLFATNGVLHVVDELILPLEPSSEPSPAPK